MPGAADAHPSQNGASRRDQRLSAARGGLATAPGRRRRSAPAALHVEIEVAHEALAGRRIHALEAEAHRHARHLQQRDAARRQRRPGQLQRAAGDRQPGAAGLELEGAAGAGAQRLQ